MPTFQARSSVHPAQVSVATRRTPRASLVGAWHVPRVAYAGYNLGVRRENIRMVITDVNVQNTASEQRKFRQIYARRGAMLGALAGLLCVRFLIATSIDPSVTEHKAIFPFAVLLLCSFSVGLFLMFTLLGSIVGGFIARSATGSKSNCDL